MELLQVWESAVAHTRLCGVLMIVAGSVVGAAALFITIRVLIEAAKCAPDTNGAVLTPFLILLVVVLVIVVTALVLDGSARVAEPVGATLKALF